MKTKTTRRFVAAAAGVLFAASLSACSSSSNAAGSCSDTKTKGKLTIATGQPAYYPWVIDDKPESGQGFESAVAYAVAAQLGYPKENVQWTRTTFDGAIAPGDKKFDFNIQQFSITAARKKAVDFSSAYYTAPQAVVSYKGSPIAGVKTLAGLKHAKLGAAVGTTSLDAVKDQIGATPAVFNDNAAAITALKNGQIDGLVADLPTAFFLSGVDIENGIIVGQLPSTGSGDEFGLLLAKDSPLTKCVSDAVDSLKSDGTLDRIAGQWLGTDAGAPLLK